MKFLTKISLLIALVISTSGIAQTAAKANTYNLNAPINEMTLTIGGVLVVATNDGLVGIKPSESQPIFTFTNFGKLKPEETEYIPNSPYIVVSQGATSKLAGLAKTKRAVINYIDGTVLFNSEDDQWNQIYTCNVILPENKLIVSGIQKIGDKAEKMTPKIAVYDLATSNLDYSFFLSEPGRVGVGKNYNITGTPLLLSNYLIIPTAQGLLAKSHTGGDVWTNKVKNVQWMVADESENEIYGFQTTPNGKNTNIYKIGKNGESLWADERKVKGIVSNFEILPQGLAVVSNKSSGGGSKLLSQKDESEIAFLSANNGEDLWEKAPKTKGYVQHFYVQDDGILFGIYEGGINKISFDGKTVFKKPLKTGENIMTMAETPQGLIYITSEDANIVNLKTGESVWKKPLKYKNAAAVASTYDSKNNRYLIAAKDQLFAIDADSGDISELGKIKFDEKEDAGTMEMKDGNIYLSSSQNMILLNEDGDEIYHTYFKSPSKSGLAKVLAGAVAVASTAMAMAASARAGMNRTGFGGINDLSSYNEIGKQDKRAADMFAAIGSASFKFMSQRFKASSATENSHFILTKLDDGIGLVKVDKVSGEVAKEIVLNDKKPEYEIDERGGYLFYKSDKDKIEVFDLN